MVSIQPKQEKGLRFFRNVKELCKYKVKGRVEKLKSAEILKNNLVVKHFNLYL